MTTKRDDLQAIRGIAIGLVLLFHLQPRRFPLGFVGVDMFFVLSSFLMTMILSKECFGTKMVTKFYLRRFKRIVPVYYVTIASVFIGCAFLLLQPDKEQLLVDLNWAVSFTSNIQPFFEKKGYWDQITEYRFFVHCWSLGVEIQYYVLAPFLISSLNGLSSRVRILSCFSIALLIKYPSSLSILSNPILIYLGNLSYTMYLLHWPVIVAAKYYYSLRELDLIETILLATVVLFLTLTVHYIVEKPLVTSRTAIGLLVSVLCLAGIYISEPYYNQCCLKSTTSKEEKINITEAIKWNLYESKKVYYKLPCDPDNITPVWNNWTAEPQLRCQTYSNGTLKILVIGNSIAYRAFPLIKEVLRGRYKELRLFSRSSSPPLSNKHPEVTAAARIVADRMHADVIWNIHVEVDPYMINPISNLTTDRAFLEFQRNLDYYSNRTKLFIIDLPYYWADKPICHELAVRLQHGNSLEDLKRPKSVAVKQQVHHRTRLLSLNCSKCLYNDVEEYLFEGDTYWYYNRANLHGYTKEGAHFTPEFLKRLKPLYENTVEDVLKRLK